MKCPTCGKVAHPTREAAMRHAHSLGKAGASFADLNAYQCKGGVWHVGHSVVKFKRRIKTALRGAGDRKRDRRRGK